MVKAKIVFGAKGSGKFEDSLNEALGILQEKGFSVLSVTPISETPKGWTCTILYQS